MTLNIGATLSTPNPLPANDNSGPPLIIVTGILTGLSIITTCVRCWVRRVNRQVGWDDYLIVVATLLIIARLVLEIISVRKGSGRHVWYVTAEDYQWVAMTNVCTQLILFSGICLLKMSICILLLRSFSVVPAVKCCVYALMAGLIVTNLEPFIVLLAECRPFKAAWEPTKDGHCWSFDIRIYSIWVQVGYSIFSDFICSLLPIIVLVKLKISLRLKILLCGLMSLGLVATAFALVRAIALKLDTSDISRDYSLIALWTNIEYGIGIIAANAACGRSIYGYFRNVFKVQNPDDEPNSGSQYTHLDPKFSARSADP